MLYRYSRVGLRLPGFLVNPPMLLQEAAGNETFAAVDALVWPFAGMVPKMQDQRGPLCESSAALRATVRFFSRVHSPMNTEVLFAGELLVA